MTVGIKDLVDQINSEIDSPANDSTRVAQLAGSTTFNTYSVATVDALPLASENTGRFVLVLSSDSYYFSDGVKWTNKVESTVGGILSPWLWGRAQFGLLADNTLVNKSSPISLNPYNLGWIDIFLSSCTASALRADNTIWAWGCNNSGQLGDGTTVSKSSPVSVVGGFTDWSQVSGKNDHTLGLRKNGTLWSWGKNTYGRLGDGTIVAKSSPVSVVGGFTDWCQIAGSKYHSVGLRSNCTIWTWGQNTGGKLGDGTTVSKSSPVSVVGGFTDWCQIGVGVNNSLAIRSNGTLWAWGCNAYGQFGDGTTVNKSSPVSVVGGFTDWCQVTGGDRHSIGVRKNGTLWSWGSNAHGRLGDGTTVCTSSPVSVVGGFTDWCQVNAGLCHNISVRSNGTLWAWGHNGYGQLGDNTAASKSSPVSVVGGFTDWCKGTAGDMFSAALRYIPKGL